MPEPRQYPKGEAKRAEILDAALDIIGRDGYSRATVNQIAQAVGITPNGVLHYFGSKEAMLVAVVEARDFREDPDQAPHSPFAVIAGYPEFMARSAAVPGLVQLFSRLANEATEGSHDGHAYFVSRYERVREAWRGMFEEIEREGRLRSGLDPETLATMVVALSDGLQTQWLYDPAVDMPEALRTLFRMAVVDAPG